MSKTEAGYKIMESCQPQLTAFLKEFKIMQLKQEMFELYVIPHKEPLTGDEYDNILERIEEIKKEIKELEK